MIRIISKHEGFRRCGIAHSCKPTDYPDGRFSKAELKTMQETPGFTVEILKGKPAEVTPPAAAAVTPDPALATLREALTKAEADNATLAAELQAARDEIATMKVAVTPASTPSTEPTASTKSQAPAPAPKKGSKK